MAANLFPLQITSIITETADTSSFVLHTPPGFPEYQAGQFLTFVFKRNDGSEERRSYSISSSPVLNEPLQITVKRIANGAYSRKLVDDAVVGDLLYTIGPSGFFVLPDDLDPYEQLVFFAAGSGITPVFSMIKTVLHSHPSIQLLLLYSTSAPGSAIFYEELLHLQGAFPGRLKVEFLFSNAAPRRRLNVGMIENVALQYGNNALYYLCGPVTYMRTISIVLRTEGVPEQLIRKEIFHIELPPAKELPPDTLPHRVTAQIGNERFEFDVQYPETILQAAKRLSVPIPYSCEAGQCGTCAANCISGNVWMWHNEVLLDDELSAGRVLTCTGYPVGGDIRIEFP